MLYLLILGFGLGPVFQRAGSGSYLQFVAPGVIGMSILFSSIFSGVGLLFDRQFGFLKETLVAPIPRSRIMIGRTLGGATVAVIQGTLVMTVCVIAGFRPASISALPVAFGFMLLIAVVFGALGTAIGSMLQDMQGFQLIMNFMVMADLLSFRSPVSLGESACGAEFTHKNGPARLRYRRHSRNSDQRHPLRPGFGYIGPLRRRVRVPGDWHILFFSRIEI